MAFIILWKIAGAPTKPNSITLNCYFPSGVTKAVFGLDDSLTDPCLYPWVRSKSSGILLLPGYQSSPLSSALERGLDGHCIDLPIIYTDPYRPILLCHQHDGGGSCTGAWRNQVIPEHLLYLFLDHFFSCMG